MAVVVVRGGSYCFCPVSADVVALPVLPEGLTAARRVS